MSDQKSRVGSSSKYEDVIGFSRAVRTGNQIFVAGTAAINADGMTAAIGDVYGQTVRCFEIVREALHSLDAQMEHVVRTRIYLRDAETWKEAARAHGEVFSGIKPACTFVEVKGFIDPEWLVEVEVDAVVN